MLYIDGIPTLKEGFLEPTVNILSERPSIISLNPLGQPGEDCLRLKFNIDEQCNLTMEEIDLRNNNQKQAKKLCKVR